MSSLFLRSELRYSSLKHLGTMGRQRRSSFSACSRGNREPDADEICFPLPVNREQHRIVGAIGRRAATALAKIATELRNLREKRHTRTA